MENKDKNTKKNRNKIIIIIIIIILLLLLLIKLYFEFKAERERVEEIRAEKNRTEQETNSRKSLIDSLCSAYPNECSNFEKFGNVGNIMNYADSLLKQKNSDKEKLNAFIDSICQIDIIKCEEYKNGNFASIEELQDFLYADSMNRKNIAEDEAAQRKRDKEADCIYGKIELNSLVDSLCKIDSANCGKYKEFNYLQDSCDFYAVSEKLRGLRKTAEDLKKRQLNSLIDSLCKIDSVNCEKYKQVADIDELRKLAENLKNQREKEIADSIANENTKKTDKSACNDTIAPWVYPEPTGGLYFEPVKLSFFVSKPNVSVFYKRSKEAEFRLWSGEEISISQNTEFYYYAIDSCENLFEEQKKVYEFRDKPVQNVCPEGMAPVESPQGNFCIDQYEWANKRGVRPTNMISQTQARDSCLSVGKRLCTAGEWTAACKGPYNWKYPYGDKYIKRACITQDTTFRRSEEAGECRGWYAIYDMTGNLAEWTSTRSEENNRFFVVKGGFWESGAAASCEMSRYSYYPQNQHTPVGFRCCKSLETE